MSVSSESRSLTSSGTISAADRFAIEDLLGRYLWAVDIGDLEGLLAVFTRDAVVRYADGPSYEGEDGLRQFGMKAIGNLSARGRMHLNQSLFAQTDGDTVVLRSYLLVPQAPAGEEDVRLAAMRYTEDRFRKTAEGWRICERVIHKWPGAAICSANEHERSPGAQ